METNRDRGAVSACLTTWVVILTQSMRRDLHPLTEEEAEPQSAE